MPASNTPVTSFAPASISRTFLGSTTSESQRPVVVYTDQRVAANGKGLAITVDSPGSAGPIQTSWLRDASIQPNSGWRVVHTVFRLVDSRCIE